MARGVIALNKNGVDIYIPSLASILHAVFPEAAVRDMEVVSTEQVTAVFKSLFATSKVVPPLSFVIVVSESAQFVRSFPKPHTASGVPAVPPHPASLQAAHQTPPAQPAPPVPPVPPVDSASMKKLLSEQDAQIQAFLEKVPFENVSSVTITQDAQRVVVATNKDLIGSIKNALTMLHFEVEAVSPLAAFHAGVVLTGGLTPQIAATILAQSDVTHKYDFLRTIVIPQTTPIDPKTGKEKPSNKRAYLLIGVMALLFIFMIGLYLMMYGVPGTKKPVKRPVRTPAAKKVKPTQAVTPTLSASASAELLKTVKVQIVTNAQTAANASSVRGNLGGLGITSITVTSQPSTSVPKTFVLFSSDISSSVRQLIIAELEKTFSSVSTQESTSSKNTVVVTLGPR